MSHDINIDNSTLVKGCLKGDKEALSLFYIRFAPKMMKVVQRYVTDMKDAEDILHDGFIVAFTRLDSLRNLDRVDYWLATIMKNLSLQFLNSQDLEDILHEVPDIEDISDIEDIIDLDTLESLIKQLPEGYRNVFRLAVLENKSHKEIANLLGIAPNSSSSQLFHAKMMMRRLITDYRRQAGALSLLILAAAGVFLLLRQTNDHGITLREPIVTETNGHDATPPTQTDIHEEKITANRDTRCGTTPLKSPIVAGRHDNDADSTETIAHPATAMQENGLPTSTDTTHASPESKIIDIDETYLADVDVNYIKRHHAQCWALNVGVNAGLYNFNNSADRSDYVNDDFNSSANPNDPTDDPLNPTPQRNAAADYKDYNNVSHRHSMPVSFTVSVNKSLSKMFSVESGLTYTYLHSTFESERAKSDCRWHYLGIPLKMNFNIYSTQYIKFYASAGARVDFPISSYATVTSQSGNPDLRAGKFNSAIVWSLTGSYGASFKLSSRMEIFVEPTLQYHFSHSQPVPDIWTDNRWDFSLPVGFRLNW